MENHLFALLGKSLSHSYSPTFYNSYFANNQLVDHKYITIEIPQINELLPTLDSFPNLEGFNVTIPYKEQIIPYLDQISPIAKKIGAINLVKVIKTHDQRTYYGYNTDYKGFGVMFKKVIKTIGSNQKAIILGTGGASKCVQYFLSKKMIPFVVISRNKNEHVFTYQELTGEIIQTHKIIINCTPLGMYLNIKEKPPIDYDRIGSEHYLIDLIYNPDVTEFMKEGLLRSAHVMNGLQMFKVQAKESLKIFL